MRPPTATGNPRYLVGYYLGQIMCRIGLHKRAGRTWEFDLMEPFCLRPGCER